MKKKIVVILLAVLVLVSAGFVLAEEEEKAEPQKREARTGRTNRARPDMGSVEGRRAMPPRQGGMDRESMFKDQMEKRSMKYQM